METTHKITGGCGEAWGGKAEHAGSVYYFLADIWDNCFCCQGRRNNYVFHFFVVPRMQHAIEH